MSEIRYVTTTGRYGQAHPSDPAVPEPDDDGWVITLVGSAAADGLLFWFWHCEKPDPPQEEIVHAVDGGHNDVTRMKALCGAGTPAQWPKGERWSDDQEKVTCPKCLELKEPAIG